MTEHNLDARLSRRRLLALGGTVAGSLITAGAPVAGQALTVQAADEGNLPVREIERILQADGTVTNGVLTIEPGRTDLHVTGPGGIPVDTPWALDHEFRFESLGSGKAALNGELTVLEREINPVVDELLDGGLELTAVHNHLIETNPVVMYIHFKGIGDPIDLARASAAAMKVTPTPLPQHMPTNPTTPLHEMAMARILGGTSSVKEMGVVEVDVPRAETIVVEGVVFRPDMAVQVMVLFEPLDGGRRAAVQAELPLVAGEVNPVSKVLRQQGVQITALHHHELAERPQLYFLHAFAVGTDVELARKVATALDRMNLKRG